jgi:hypothetical protein
MGGTQAKPELAAVVLLTEACLELFREYVTLRSGIQSGGGEVHLQDGIELDPDATLAPHGIAAFLIRSALADRIPLLRAD